MFTIPSVSFPKTIKVLARKEYPKNAQYVKNGLTNFAKIVYSSNAAKVKIAKQKVVTNDNLCLEYIWSEWYTYKETIMDNGVAVEIFKA